jgi:hypothetical protein
MCAFGAVSWRPIGIAAAGLVQAAGMVHPMAAVRAIRRMWDEVRIALSLR